jgi:hypothetical protein
MKKEKEKEKKKKGKRKFYTSFSNLELYLTPSVIFKSAGKGSSLGSLTTILIYFNILI